MSGLRLGDVQGRPVRRDHRHEHPRLRRDAAAAVERRGHWPGSNGGRPVGLALRRHPAAATMPTRPSIAVAGFTGSVLTNIALIDGLQELSTRALGVTSLRRRQHHPRRRRQRHHRGPRRRRPHRRRRLAQRAHQRVENLDGTGARDRQLRQHGAAGPAHGQRDLQPRPAQDRPRDPAWGCRRR